MKMYKCIENVGPYVLGDIIPDDKAELYIKMFKYSPVTFIPSEPIVTELIPEPVVKQEPVIEIKKEQIDISELSDKSQDKVKDIVADLKDDGKLNQSNKKKKR